LRSRIPRRFRGDLFHTQRAGSRPVEDRKRRDRGAAGGSRRHDTHAARRCGASAAQQRDRKDPSCRCRRPATEADADMSCAGTSSAMTRAASPVERPHQRSVVTSVASSLVLGFLLPCTFALAQSRADAQSYPARPIRIIVPNTAGSGMDNVTRMIGQRFTEAWGQQVIVDDRPGASGIIGHDLAAKAAPDGYTLILATAAGVVINPLLTKVPYDSVRDFAPISLVVTSIQMLSSHPSVAAGSLEE